MSKLNYNIYSNINDDDFLNIRASLIPIEMEMVQILKDQEWRVHSSVQRSDALCVDFVKKDSLFYGNLGLMFDDKPQKTTFSFYVTKSLDQNGVRYFLAEDIFQSKNLDFFKFKVAEFTQLATIKYNSWQAKDVISNGEKITRGEQF